MASSSLFYIMPSFSRATVQEGFVLDFQYKTQISQHTEGRLNKQAEYIR